MGGTLILDSITVRDLGSYAGEQTVRFGGRGPVAVVGSNGAGKSTLVSKALVWCLYGKYPPERMGAGTRALTGKGVIREGAKEAAVVVRLNDVEPDGTTYEITRKGASVSIECYHHGSGTSGPGGSTQADVDRLIGADYDVFTRTVVRAQNDPWNFAEATDGKKREILDAVSGAGRLAVTFERANTIRKTADADAAQHALRAADAERRAGEQDPEPLKANAAAWEAARASRVAAAEAEVRSLEEAVQAARAADAERDAVMGRRREVEARRPTLDAGPYEAAKRAAMEEATKANQLKYGLELQWRQVASLDVGAGCPTCGQTIGPEAPIAHKRNELLQPMADADQAAHHANTHVQACTTAQDEANAWLWNAVMAWQAELDAIPLAQGGQEGALRRALDIAQARLNDARTATNPHTEAAERAAVTRYSFQREAAWLREAEAAAVRTSTIAKAWEEVTGPKGVRAHLSDGALAAIEAGANRWLTALSDGRLSVEFPCTRETTKGATKEEIRTVVRARTPLGEVTERDLLSYSGGERRRVNIAVDLGVASAFSRGGGLALSLIVLDEEAFSGLDEEGKRAVAEAFHDAGVADVVVIDHDPRLAALMPRTLRVDRGPDGWSRVVEV